jgi:class 3 adenylate cyclase/tetratricopeptide (TPR) repeat protein
VLCPACQAPNPPANKFCGECGGKLSGAASPPAATTVAPAAAQPVTPPPPAGPAVDRFASPASYTPKHLAEKILTSRSAIEGERKQVTVMFTDVSSFTAMSERLDPEEVHAIMDRAFEVILDAVHEYEGTINQFLGDGVMALFGAPIAHEDHAGRALRAALAIQQKLEPLRADVQRVHGREFRMRIGVNSGPVVVGAIGRDLRMDYTAVGDTVNLAARLLSIAQPGQIVLSRRTKTLCEGYFVFDDLGTFEVKGKTEPVPAYAVQREIGGRTRLEVSRERGLTPLVGRVVERERLTETFRQASAGRGGVVVLSGEAGVGKSRLLYEFLRTLDGTDHLEFETTCASFGRAMAYRPVIELYRRYLNLKEGLGPDEIKQCVAECLGALGLEEEEDERSWLFHHFLGVPVPPEFLLRVQGANLRDQTNELLGNVILRESERRPVIAVVENVHWIDASSAEFLRALGERVRDHRVLLVLTTRPGASLPWLPSTTETIAVDALDSTSLRAMVQTLFGTTSVAEPLLRLLLAKGEGNPLYVEEIVRQLQETDGIVIEEGEARLRAADVTVPETIRDIIAARVDRLDESPKQTLQVASVVGRRFGVSLVSHVRATPREVVAGDLTSLHTIDFVFPSSTDPELMYSFKHALTQDVVYGSLLERRRRAVHAECGRGLEELYTGHLDEFVEILAYHFERSGDDERAVDYAILAAGKAQRRWANTEALSLLEAALKRLGTMPDSEANRHRRIDAVVKQAEIKLALGRHAEHVQALEAIRPLVDESADPPRAASWYFWTGFCHSLTGAPPALTISYCRRAIDIAESAGLADVRASAECCLTHVYVIAGELQTSLAVGTRALAFFDAQGDVWWACRALWGLSIGTMYAGAWSASLDYCKRAIEYGMAVNDRRLKVVGWWRAGWTHIHRGDAESGVRCCEEALALSPSPFDATNAKATQGYGLVKSGAIERGIAQLEECVAWFEQSQLPLSHSSFAVCLGEGYLRQGRRAEARQIFTRVLATSREAGYRHFEGISQRLLGESLIAEDPAGAAENLDAALRILEQVGARNEIAKTVAARAELQRVLGDVDAARQTFERALELFESLGTLDGPVRVRAALAGLQADAAD